jgi:hypothetical protein
MCRIRPCRSKLARIRSWTSGVAGSVPPCGEDNGSFLPADRFGARSPFDQLLEQHDYPDHDHRGAGEPGDRLGHGRAGTCTTRGADTDPGVDHRAGRNMHQAWQNDLRADRPRRPLIGELRQQRKKQQEHLGFRSLIPAHLAASRIRDPPAGSAAPCGADRAGQQDRHLAATTTVSARSPKAAVQ